MTRSQKTFRVVGLLLTLSGILQSWQPFSVRKTYSGKSLSEKNPRLMNCCAPWKLGFMTSKTKSEKSYSVRSLKPNGLEPIRKLTPSIF